MGKTTPELAWCTGPCQEDRRVERLMNRIANVTRVPLSNLENFRILRYSSGQKDVLHHDGREFENELASGPRIYTFVLYLADVDEGGELHFPKVGISGLRILPRKGSAVLWPSVTSANPTVIDPRTAYEVFPVK